MNDPVIECVRKPLPEIAGLWLVKVEGVIVGMLERYKNTHATKHPWKAFKGTGLHAIYLGAFYVAGEVPKSPDTIFGGKKAAIAAIL